MRYDKVLHKIRPLHYCTTWVPIFFLLWGGVYRKFTLVLYIHTIQTRCVANNKSSWILPAPPYYVVNVGNSVPVFPYSKLCSYFCRSATGYWCSFYDIEVLLILASTKNYYRPPLPLTHSKTSVQGEFISQCDVLHDDTDMNKIIWFPRIVLLRIHNSPLSR